MFLYKNVFPVVSDWFPSTVGNIITWHRVAELQLVRYPRWLGSTGEYGPRQLRCSPLLWRSLPGELRAQEMT